MTPIVTHEFALMLAKIFGLIYLIVFFVIVVLHTYRPSGKAKAEHAANSILAPEDHPWP